MTKTPNSVSVPVIGFSDQEQQTGRASQDKTVAAARAFVEHGAVYLSNVFSGEYIDTLYKEYVRKYEKYFQEDLYDDALPVGNRRMMVPVEVTGLFNDPLIYGNPVVVPILQLLLGKSFIMSGFGSVLSLPGAEAQHIHRDHPPLYEELEGKAVLPPFSITTVIPLIGLDSQTGSTRIYPGTHRLTMTEARQMPFVEPEVPVGSMLLWDNLVYHGGAPNHSDRVRPLLYFNYARPWFRDSGNYERHEPLLISDGEFDKVPEGLKPLFAWSRPPDGYDLTRIKPDEQCPCYSGKLFRDCHGRDLQT